MWSFGLSRRRLPRRRVHVGAEEQRVGFGIVRRRGPDAARRGTVLERVLAPGTFHDDRRIELLRLRADVVLPDDLAGLRLERHQEAAAGAAGVLAVPAKSCSSVPPPKMTLPSARIGEAIKRLFQWAPGKLLRPAVDLPALLPGVGVEAVHPAAGIREVNGPVRDQRRAEDPRVRTPRRAAFRSRAHRPSAAARPCGPDCDRPSGACRPAASL